jgi:hypothetical protein
MRFLPCRTAKENIDTSASLCYVASFPSQHGAKWKAVLNTLREEFTVRGVHLRDWNFSN